MLSFAQIIKDSPGVGDVHVSSTPSQTSRRRRRRASDSAIAPVVEALSKDESHWRIDVPISKHDDELRCVYGWATVNAEKGILVTDHQDDQISDAELTKAAHDFVASGRTGGLLHALRDDGLPHQGGQIVESMVLTQDVQKALGIDLSRTGWFIGYRVDDPDAWALVKSGTLKAFSIGGRARRVPLRAAS